MKILALSITALLAVSSAALHAKPPAPAPRRGPLPGYFLNPVSVASTQYPEADKPFPKELDAQIRVEAEHAQEALRKLEGLLGRVVAPLGFQRLDEAQIRQFNLWKYERPSAPGEALSRLGGHKVVFAVKDGAALQKWLDATELLNSRSEGPAKGRIRQLFLRATVAGGAYSDGGVSFRLRFQPVMIGSLSYENPRVQENEISNLFAINPFFNPEKLLIELESALGTLASDPGIGDLKINLKS